MKLRTFLRSLTVALLASPIIARFMEAPIFETKIEYPTGIIQLGKYLWYDCDAGDFCPHGPNGEVSPADGVVYEDHFCFTPDSVRIVTHRIA